MKDFEHALMLIEANKLDGAKDLLEDLIKTDPQDKDILYNLGMCYTELDFLQKTKREIIETL